MDNLEPIDITKSTSFNEPNTNVDFTNNQAAFNKLDDNTAKDITVDLNDPLAKKVHSLFGLSVKDNAGRIENTTGTSQENVTMVAQQHMQKVYELEQQYNAKVDQLTKQYGDYSNIPIEERASLKQAKVDIVAFKTSFSGQYNQGNTHVEASNSMPFVQDLVSLTGNNDVLKTKFNNQPYRTVEYDKNTGKFVAKVHIPGTAITGNLASDALNDTSYHNFLQSKGIEPTKENALKFYTTYLREFGKSALDIGSSAGKLLDDIIFNGKYKDYYTTGQQLTQNLFGTTNADTQIADAYASNAAKDMLKGNFKQGLGNLYESLKKGGLNYLATSLPYMVAYLGGGELKAGANVAKWSAGNMIPLMGYIQNNLDYTAHNNGNKSLTTGQKANAAMAGILEYALDKIGLDAMVDTGVFKVTKGKLFVNLGDKPLPINELIKINPQLGTKLAQYIKNSGSVLTKAALIAGPAEFANEAGQQVLETFSQKYNKPGSNLFDPNVKFSNDDKVNILTAGLLGYGLGAGIHSGITGISSTSNLRRNLKNKDLIVNELMGAVKGMTREEATQYMNNLQTELNKQYAKNAPFSMNPVDGSFDVNAFNNIMNVNNRNAVTNEAMNQQKANYFKWLSKVQQLEHYKNLIAKANDKYFYQPVSDKEAKLSAEKFIKNNLNKAPGLGITSQLAINGLLGVGATVAATGGIATPMAVLTGFALGQKIPVFNFLYQTTKVSNFKNFISNLPTAKLQELKYVLNDPRIMDTVDKAHKTLYDKWIDSVNTELDIRNKAKSNLINAFNLESNTPENTVEINTLYNRYKDNKDITEGLDTLKDIGHTKHFSDSLVKLSNALKAINEIKDDRDKATLVALVDNGARDILDNIDPEHLKSINEDTYNTLKDNLTTLSEMSNNNLGSSVSDSEEELADRIAKQVMASLQHMLQQNPVFNAIMTAKNYGEFKKKIDEVSNDLLVKGYTDQYGTERLSLNEHIDTIKNLLDDKESANTEQEANEINKEIKRSLDDLYTLLASRSTTKKFINYNVNSPKLAMAILNENQNIIDGINSIIDKLNSEEQKIINKYINDMLTVDKLAKATNTKVNINNVLELLKQVTKKESKKASNKKSGNIKKTSNNKSTKSNNIFIGLSKKLQDKFSSVDEYIKSSLSNVHYDNLIIHYRLGSNNNITIYVKAIKDKQVVGFVRLFGKYNIDKKTNRATINIASKGNFVSAKVYTDTLNKLGAGSTKDIDPNAKKDKNIISMIMNIINHDNTRRHINKAIIDNIDPNILNSKSVNTLNELKSHLKGAYAYSDILKLTRKNNTVTFTILYLNSGGTLSTAYSTLEFKDEKNAEDISKKIATLRNINNIFYKNTTMAYSTKDNVKARLHGIDVTKLNTISGIATANNKDNIQNKLYNSFKYTLEKSGNLLKTTNTEPTKVSTNEGITPTKIEEPEKKVITNTIETTNVNDEYDSLLKESISNTSKSLREKEIKDTKSSIKFNTLKNLFNKKINKFKRDIKQLSRERFKINNRTIRKGSIIKMYKLYTNVHNRLNNKLFITNKVLNNIEDPRIINIKADVRQIYNNYKLDDIPSSKIDEYIKNIDTIINNIDTKLKENNC